MTGQRIFLVRHAQTRIDPGTPAEDWHLTQDAMPALAALRPTLPPSATWFTSPELKARASAAALTDRPITIDDGLAEVRRVGFHPDYEATVTRLFAEPDAAPAPRWETAAAATERFAGAVRRCRSLADPAEDLVLVSHGLVISLFLAHLRGGRVRIQDWRDLQMPDVRVVD